MGPIGIVSRLLIGVLFLYVSVVGLYPLFVTSVTSLTLAEVLRFTSPPNPEILILTVAWAFGLFLFFIGISLLLAGLYRFGGCEVVAIPNLLFNREWHVFCPLFSPIDRMESALRGHMSKGRNESKKA